MTSTTREMNDEELLAAIRNGEGDRPLEIIYTRYREPCLRFLLGRIISSDQPNRQELAVELFTEALLILTENTLTGRLTELTARLDTYLNAVARNLYLRMLRRGRETYLSPDRLPQPLILVDTDEEAELTRREVHQKIRELGNRCRQLLTHFYFLELDWETIAELLGYKNAASAKTNKSKCMVRLRALYGLTKKSGSDGSRS